ncbi:DUF2806 domain-containing protein, partial [Paracoccus aminovorans]|uniref:DUF2806 domain-containing protein n=1 Tax=Paracoccus aminovorans TaxID=34004 RepID=UPI001C1298FA
MSDDHLSNEIAVAGELTDTGVKASVRSRAISAFDRLVGAAVDVMNAHVEGFAERKRAKNRGEVAMIEQITRYGVEQLGADPDLAQRAVEKHFRKVISQQENIEAVVREAHADLIDGNQDYEDVPGDIAAEFFDKFEQYSASASTDELRHRWGRVLASEIRKPGT